MRSNLRVVLLSAAASACLRSPAPSGTRIVEAADTGSSPPVRFAMRLDEAWVEPGKVGESTRAFVCISSDWATPIAVRAVATPAAGRVRYTDQTSTPPMLADLGGFLIPAAGSVHMHPGGAWLELEGLRVALVPGDKIRLGLAMPGAMTIWVEAEVRRTTLAVEVKPTMGRGSA